MGNYWTPMDEYGELMTTTLRDVCDNPVTEHCSLNEAVDFDAPFIVDDSGNVLTDRFMWQEPDVMLDDDGDIDVSDGWETLTGYTGQYGYAGAIMHPSETLSGALARDILSTPGTYCVVEVRDADGDYPDGDPIGWAVCRMTS